MSLKEKIMRLLATVLILIVLAVIFRLTLRPFLLNWGATETEQSIVLKSDSIITSPSYNSTRAITIDAKPRDIYPYLVQMGRNKAGLYGYDWLNNGFRRSAESIVRRYQNLNLGDTVDVSLFLKMKVVQMEKDSLMVWQDMRSPSQGTWTWLLIPVDKRKTRLVSRLRIDYDWLSAGAILHLGSEIGDMPAMRKTLNGIKERAEEDVIGSFSIDLAEGFFILVPFLALLLFFVRIFKKEKWWEPVITFLFILVLFLLVVYVKMPLWTQVIITFIVLLTVIGTAAETAAVKKSEASA